MRDGPPLPEQQGQCGARRDDISAALGVPGNKSRPAALKSLPRHHAVLNGEDAQENQINDNCLGRRRFKTVVDRLWNKETTGEANCVRKSSQEEQVRK
jgi:hypothetical protein